MAFVKLHCASFLLMANCILIASSAYNDGKNNSIPGRLEKLGIVVARIRHCIQRKVYPVKYHYLVIFFVNIRIIRNTDVDSKERQ